MKRGERGPASSACYPELQLNCFAPAHASLSVRPLSMLVTFSLATASDKKFLVIIAIDTFVFTSIDGLVAIKMTF